MPRTFPIATLLLIFIISETSLAQQPFRFAFFTDIHINGKHERVQNFQKACERAESLNCEFIITGGDNADANTWFVHPDSAIARFKIYQSIIEKSDLPIYSSIGNHDRFLKTSEENSLHNTGLFESHTGLNEYYSFDYQGYHFIVLNNVCYNRRTYDYHMDRRQIYWLRRDLLKTGTTTPVIAIVHVPLQRLSRQFSKSINQRKPIAKRYLELWNTLKAYNIKAVLQGHTHIYNIDTIEEVPLITGGVVTKSLWSSWFNTTHGFVVIDCSDDCLKFEYINLYDE